MAYHMHWAYDEILDLETVERRHFVRMLAEEIERHNAALDGAGRGR